MSSAPVDGAPNFRRCPCCLAVRRHHNWRYGTRLASLAGLNGGLVDDALLGALAGIADAAKDSVSTASYGKNGQVVLATDALGGTTKYAYDAFGELVQRTTSIDGSHALVETAQYDKRGELVAQSTGGVTAKRDYDAFGRVVRSVDGNGNATTQDYDKLGHVVTVTDPTHAVRKSSYDAFGRVLTQTDATGNTISYAYDDAARSVTLTTAEGVTMTVVHDRHGQTQRVTDGNGNVTSYSYDANGKLVDTGNSLGHTHNVYDAAGRLTESVDANGNVVRYCYDAANRLLSRTVDPDGLALTTSYQYDAKGEQVAVTDANGVVTTTRYDLKGQVVEQVVDPAGLALSTRYSYDQRGQVLTVTNPGGVVTQYVYDDKGRRIEEHVDPAGLNQTRRYAYDNNGNVVAVTDALGNVSRYAYDADNRLVYAVDGAGNVKQTSYDAAGRVVSAIQYAKPIALDGLGQQASVAEIAARVSATPGQDAGERRVYDKDGRVRYTVDGAGGVTRYSYGGKGNVTERVSYANRIDLNAWVPGTAPAVVEDPSRDLRTRMVYDANNRAIYSIDGTGAVSARKYDANGNVVETIAYANRVPVSTAASAAAIEAALVADSARDTHVRNTYDSANRLAWSVDGTGSVTQNVYDKDGNLVKRVQYAKEIAQGADPRSVTASAGDRVTLAAYDSAQRLVFQADARGNVTRQVYDANGNLTRRIAYTSQLAAPTAATVTPGVAQLEAAVASFGSVSEGYGYDALGRTVGSTDATGVKQQYIYDAEGRLLVQVDGGGRVTQYVYNAAGQRVQTLRRAVALGQQQLSTLQGNPGALATLVQADAADQASYTLYDGTGKVAKEVDAAGYVTEYRYDGDGNRVAAIRYANAADVRALGAGSRPQDVQVAASADDRTTYFYYDSNNRPVGMVDAEGYVTAYRYDAAGRQVEAVRYANRTQGTPVVGGSFAGLAPAASSADQHSYTLYDGEGRVTGTVDAEGYLTERSYDADGNVVRSVRYANRVAGTVNAGSSVGEIRPAASARDQVTTQEFDGLGRRVSSTNAEGVRTEYTYDANGNVTAAVAAAGTAEARTTTQQYDALGRVTEVKAGANGATYTYDAAGRRTSSTDANGNRTLYYYNRSGELTHTINALGEVEERRYDALGEQVAQVRYGTRLASLAGLNGGLVDDALLAALAAIADATKDSVSTASYGKNGQVLVATDALGGTTQYAYDAFGELVQRTTSIDGSHALVETVQYDKRGELVAQTTGGVTAKREYDAFGRVVRSVDGNGNATSQDYDKLGHVVTVTDPTHAVRKSSYDAFGRVLTQTDATGNMTSYAYDDAARSVTLTTAEGVTMTVEHDRHGQTQRVTDGNGNVTSYSYDANGKLVETGNGLGHSRNVYDAAGRLSESVDANGNVVRYSYDAANRLLSRTVDPDGLALTTSYQYDAKGEQVAVTDANGVVTTTRYDLKGQVVEQVVDPAGLALSTRYSYDGRGQVLTVTNPGGVVTQYVYDDKGRRIEEHVDPAGLNQTRRYAYDNNGNVVAVTDALGNVSRYAYDADNRLVYAVDGAGNVKQTSYDAAGRVVSAIQYAKAIALDGLGQQASVAEIAARVSATPGQDAGERRVYDKDGRVRFTVDGAGGVTRYSYDGKGNVTERVAYANRIDLNAWVPGTAPAVVEDPSRDLRLRMVYDANNRAIYSIDGTGAVSARKYDANGNVVETIAYANRVPVSTAASAAAIEAALVADGARDTHVRNTYDSANRLAWSVDGTGSVTQNVYDKDGNLVKRVQYAKEIAQGADPRSVTPSAGDRVTLAAYDSAQRLVFQVDARGSVTRQVYDANGNLTRRIAYTSQLAAPTAATVTPGVAQLEAAVASFGSVSEGYGYDALGRTVGSTDATGVKQQYIYDAEGRLLVQVDGGGRVTQYVYNAAGQRVQSLRRAVALGQQQLSTLQGNPGALATLVQADAADQASYTLYDGTGKVAKEVGAAGYVTEYRYDGDGNRVAAIRYANAADVRALGAGSRPQDVQVAASADDRTTYYYYDSNNRPVGMVDAEGYVTAYRYDAAGRQVEAVRYANRTQGTPVVGGSFAGLAPATSSADQHSYTLYDGEGRVTGTVDAEGYLTERSYDADGNVVRSVRYANRVAGSVNAGSSVGEIRPAASSRDQVTTQEFDALGRKVSSTNAEGVRTEYTYDANGNVTAAVAAAGTAEARTTTQQYDALGRVTEVKAGANGATYTYDAAGRRTSSTDANGNRTLYYYNRSGELTHTINALGEVEERRYDALGEQVAQVRYGTRLASLAGLNGGLVDDALLAALAGIADATKDSVSTASYGKNGQVLVATDALGGTTQYAYDAFGEEISRTQGIDGSRVLTQSSQYDKRGELVAQTTGGVTAKREYDAFGRVVRSVDGNGNATTQDYDKLGHVVTVTDPTHAVRKSSYDAFGRVLTQTDATGNTTSYAYDDAARSVTLTTAEGVTMTVEHDRHGQTQRVTDGNGNVTSYSYDANGKLVETGNGLGHSRNVYDGAGRLSESVDANGNVVRYSYDAANRLLSRTVDPDGLALTTSYQYDAKGEQVAVTDANGVVTTTRYDLKGQMVEQVVDPAGLALSTRYSYDGRGQVLTVTNPGGVVTQYVYDDKGRRIEEHVDPAGLNQTRRYAYDNNGNVVAVTDALGNVSRYAYDADNRLVYAVDGAGNVKQTGYDAAGRVVSAIQYAKAIALDGLGQQASVAEIAARVSATPGQDAGERRVYDKDGRVRYTIDGAGGVTRYSYDGKGNVTERVAYANRIDLNAWVPGTAPAVFEDPSRDLRLRMVYDANNRAIYSIDGTGAVSARKYDANGNVVETIAYANRVPVSTAASAAAIEAALVADGARDTHVRNTYDSANRLAWSVDGTGSVTQNVYDKDGNLVKRVQYAKEIAQGADPRSVTPSAGDRVTLAAYDSAQRLVFQVDARGSVTRQVYDANGNLTRRIAYTSQLAAPTAATVTPGVAQLEAAVASFGSVSEGYGYDALGRTVGSTDATGVKQQYIYDAEGRLLAQVDGGGRVTQYVYNAAGQRVQTLRRAVALGQQQLSTLQGNPGALATPLVQADAADQASYTLYDGTGKVAKEVDAAGYVTEYRYDGDGNRVAAIRYANAADVRALGAGSRPQDVQVAASADDRTTYYYYDSNNRPVGMVDAEGYVTAYRYDAAGRQVEAVRYANRTQGTPVVGGSFAGLAPAASSADQHSYTLYDGEGRVTGTVDAEGYLTERSYDADGNVVRSVRYANRVAGSVNAGSSVGEIRPAASSRDQVTTQEFDALGRKVSSTNAEGVRTEYTYDANGNVTAAVAAAGTAEARTTTQQYDALGRVTEVKAGANGTTYTYDAAGRRTSSTDANGNRTLYYYNRSGELTHTINALGEVEERRYDALGEQVAQVRYGTRLASLAGLNGGLVDDALLAALAGIADATKDSVSTASYGKNGQVLVATDALGGTTQYAYDAFGELVQRTTSIDGSHALVETVQYDKRGELVAQTTGGVTAKREYDAFGRVVRSVDGNGNATSQDYDKLGHVVTVTDPTHAVRKSSYDAFGRALTQTDATGNTTSYAYDDAARSVTLTTAEGVTMTVEHDRHGQTQRVTDGNGNVTSYSYDANGKLVETGNGLGHSRNVYDAAGRLTESVDANGNVVRYSYDAANRLLSRTVDPDGLALTTSYQYDAKGEQVAVTDANGVVTTTRYDLKGQVVEQVVDPAGLALSTRYSYDGRGQVLTVTNPGGVVTQYVYDDKGRRIEEHVDPAGLNQTRRYAYDNNGNVVAVTDALGNVSRYAYDADNRLVYAVDGAGNVKQTSYDAAGRVVSAIQYAKAIALDGLGQQASVAEIAARVSATPGQDAGERRVYDKDGRVRFTVDGAGGVTRYSYDGKGNVTERVAYANRIDLNAWVPGTAPAVVEDPSRDLRLRMVYDANNRAIYSIDGTGAVSARKYDANGNVVETIAYANRVPAATAASAAAIEAALVADGARDTHVRNTYDSANRLAWSVDGTGSVTQNVYDKDGNLVKRVQYAKEIAQGADPRSVTASAGDRVTLAAYDSAQRLVFQVGPTGAVTKQVFDAAGNVVARIGYATTITAPTATTATMTVEQLTSVVQADGLKDRVTRMTYDAAGRNVFTVDAEGSVDEARYDGNGQVIESIRYANPVGLSSLALVTNDGAVRAGLTIDAARDRRSSVAYDAAGHAVFGVDAEGYVTGNQFDGEGRLVSSTKYATAIASGIARDAASISAALVRDPAKDQVTNYEYDARGNLTCVTDPLGYKERFAYDALGHRVAYTNKNGATWEYQYDAAGRMVLEISPEVFVASLTSTANGSLALDQGGSGAVRVESRIAYDAFGHVISRTEAANTQQARTTRYEYDKAGRQTRIIYPTVDVYDAVADSLVTNGANGLAARTERSVQLYTETVYNSFGEAVAKRDLGGNLSFTAYDNAGRAAYEIDKMGYVTGFGRNAFGDAVSTTRYAKAPALSLNTATPPDSQAVGAALAPLPHIEDRTVEAKYDRMGRAVQVTEPRVWVTNGQQGTFAARITRNIFNAFGELSQQATLADPWTNTWAINSYFYDRGGRVIATSDALGYVTTREYDAIGNVVRQTEYATAATAGAAQLALPGTSADDRTTTYTYDAANRLVRETRLHVQFSDGTTDAAQNLRSYGDVSTEYAYDAAGNRTVTIDALGGKTYTAYDALGRVSAITTPSVATEAGLVSPLTVFKRDALGRVLVQISYASGSAGTTSADDRITLARYDALGNATQTTDASGVDHFSSYDENQHLRKQWQSVTGSDGKQHTLFTAYEYDAAGRVTAEITPGSTVVFDEATGAIKTVDQSSVAAVRNRAVYNGFGEVIQQGVDGGATMSYSYDKAGRLWRSASGAGDTKVMLHDLLGNRTGVLQSAGVAASSTYGDVDPLLNVSSAEQADKLTALRRTNVVVDLLGRATEIVLPARDGMRPVVHQVFDRWGNVLSRSTLNSSGSVTVYRYNANNQLISTSEPDGNGHQSSSSPVTNYFYDRLGRQIAVRDANGNVNEQSWDAAGDLTQERHADGGVVSHFYNAFREEVVRRDAENNKIVLQRDHMGRLISTTTEPVDTYAVDTFGLLARSVQNLVTKTEYDEAGRIVARRDSAGATTGYAVDLRGNVTSVHQPMGESETFAYDAQGHQIAHRDANGSLETWGYDANGRLTERTDIGGAQYSYQYDSAGQLVEEANTRGKHVRTTYDGAGQVIQVRDLAEDKTTQYSYHLGGQHTRELTVQKGVLYQDNLLAYDTNGRLARIDALADRVSVLMEYDKAGNLLHQSQTEQAHGAGTLLQAVEIDGVTQTVRHGLASSDGRTQHLWYAYDAMNRQVMIEGRVSSDVNDQNNLVEGQGHLVTYDKNGNRTSDTYQGTQLVAQIGAGGQTSYVMHQGRITMYYRYDAAGRQTESAVGAIDSTGSALDQSYATVVSQNYYDAAGRLIQSGAGDRLSAGYAQAAAANQEIASSLEVALRTYDANGRLQRERVTALSGTLVRDTSYAGGYDAVGNVLSYTITDATGNISASQVVMVKKDGYKRASLVTIKTAPSGVAVSVSSTYSYDANGVLARTDTTAALGAVATRKQYTDLSGHVLQSLEGSAIVNRLVVDGRTYAAWQGQDAAVALARWSTASYVSLAEVTDASSTGEGGGEIENEIAGMYWTLLERAPDAAGLSYWVEKVTSGQATLEDVYNAIIGSQEFKDLHNGSGSGGGDGSGGGGDSGGDGGTGDGGGGSSGGGAGGGPGGNPGPTPSEQVTQLYQQLLGRTPDANETAYWTAAMGAGTSLSQIAVQIQGSPEYENRQTTSPDYAAFDEQGNLVVTRNAGDTLQDIARRLYAPRYTQVVG